MTRRHAAPGTAPCENRAWPVLRAGHRLAAQDHSQGRSLRSRRHGDWRKRQPLSSDPPRQVLGTYRKDGPERGVGYQSRHWPAISALNPVSRLPAPERRCRIPPARRQCIRTVLRTQWSRSPSGPNAQPGRVPLGSPGRANRRKEQLDRQFRLRSHGKAPKSDRAVTVEAVQRSWG